LIILQLYLSFLKIGLFSIGGGYVMLPLLEKEFIAVKGWLTATEFVDIIAIAEMTPGPIAINTATFIGYKAGGFWGSLFATAGVITPSAVLVLLAATALKHFYHNRLVQAVFSGLRPAVLALIAGAAVSVARATVLNLSAAVFAAAAFLLLIFTRLHPILILLLAAAAGLLVFR
jgi:chromate transporter